MLALYCCEMGMRERRPGAGGWLRTRAASASRAAKLAALLLVPLAVAGCGYQRPTQILAGPMGTIEVEPPQKGNYKEGRSLPWAEFVVKAAMNAYARPEEFPSDLALSKSRVQQELKTFNAAPSAALWIGHATFLIRTNGYTILTDPVFSQGTSPVDDMGPQRYAPPALEIDQLPHIDAIMISHNHYDHLDTRSLEQLAKRYPGAWVLVPKGNERLVKGTGFTRVHGFTAGQRVVSNGLTITALPAYHETSRMGVDAHMTLALGWSIRRHGAPAMYFAGDTAYGPIFKQMRWIYGAHEVAFVPIGAYEPRSDVAHVHANPEEAAKIARELGAKVAIGMHWGTFPLADEPVMEPAVRFKKAPGNNRALKIGETIVLNQHRSPEQAQATPKAIAQGAQGQPNAVAPPKVLALGHEQKN